MREHDSERSPLPSVDPESLRHAMRRHASGVTVVTACTDELRAGITVSAFSSISLDPPIVMVSINDESSLARIVLKSGRFAVHILDRDQEDLSERFADSLSWRAKVGDYAVEPGITGMPLIQGVGAVVECVVHEALFIGSHHVIFGRVVAVHVNEPAPETPLIYYNRNYRTLDPLAEEDDTAG